MLLSCRTCIIRQSLQRGFATSSHASKDKLVVLGSGWAGYNVARQVDKSLYDVTVVSPRSHFSFTPFLASAAVGTLEFRCTTEPIRGIKDVKYAQGWADSIDFAGKQVSVEPAVPAIPDFEKDLANTPHPPMEKGLYKLDYDKLVIAVGAYSASFGIPGVAKYAHFLKDVQDSRAIRMRLLEILEQASLPHLSDSERANLLRIAIVGGGPTGVEFSAELHDFVEQDVYRLYPHLKGLVKITLYDVAPHILLSFDESLRDYAERKFRRNGVIVRGGSKILAVGEDWLELDGIGREPFGMLVWSTGLAANPFVERLEGVSHDDKTKSLLVTPHLNPTTPSGEPVTSVYAIGDNATPASGERLPATAQVASQMAKYISKRLNAQAQAKEVEEGQGQGFKWKNKGSMVFIGDYRAVVDRSSSSVSGVRARISGLIAWVMWRSYYMTLAMGWRNKLLVPFYWFLAYFFGRDITRF